MLTGLLTPGHVALILIVLLLILGPKRLPETGRALGRGLREFRDAITGAPGKSQEAEMTERTVRTELPGD
jgi:sec-independent protein translocase protein TatA